MPRIRPSKGSRPIMIAVALAATLAVVAIATPASGVSTSKLSKQIKQVKAQIAALQKQQGPPGAPGQNGAAGTARAYGTVDDDSCVAGTPETCTATKARGISTVTRDGGNYCVNAPGVDPATTSAAVSVDYDITEGTEYNAQAMLGGVATNCATGFRVRTERIGSGVGGDIAFTIVIP